MWDRFRSLGWTQMQFGYELWFIRFYFRWGRDWFSQFIRCVSKERVASESFTHFKSYRYYRYSIIFLQFILVCPGSTSAVSSCPSSALPLSLCSCEPPQRLFLLCWSFLLFDDGNDWSDHWRQVQHQQKRGGLTLSLQGDYFRQLFLWEGVRSLFLWEEPQIIPDVPGLAGLSFKGKVAKSWYCRLRGTVAAGGLVRGGASRRGGLIDSSCCNKICLNLILNPQQYNYRL